MRPWWYYLVKRVAYVVTLGLLLLGCIKTCLN